MDEFFRWLHEVRANTDWQATFAGFALIVSLIALWYSRRSSKAAAKSADAAEVSSNLARAGFENEAKRVKASAYWTLYRVQETLVNLNVPRVENCDLSPVQTLLALYSHTLTPDARSKLNTALKAIEKLMPITVHVTLANKVQSQVKDAMVSLKEDWMEIEDEHDF